MSDPPQTEQQSPWRTFSADLRTAAHTLTNKPSLVLLTVVLHLAFGAYLLATDLEHRSQTKCLDSHPSPLCHPHLWLGLLGFVYFLVTLFLFGFYGTQRVWFMRAHREQGIDRETVWRMSWSFFGRYFTIGLLGGLLLIPYGIAVGIFFSHHPGHRLPIGYSAIFYPAVFVVEVFGTLVGPALAFSTRRVWVAIPLGIRMLVKTWPQSLWHAIAPPLTIFVIGVDLVRRSAGIVSALIVSVFISPLLVLWMKSATALFYLRHVPDVGPDGAAFFARHACRNGHPVDKLALYCPVCGISVNELVYPG